MKFYTPCLYFYIFAAEVILLASSGIPSDSNHDNQLETDFFFEEEQDSSADVIRFRRESEQWGEDGAELSPKAGYEADKTVLSEKTEPFDRRNIPASESMEELGSRRFANGDDQIRDSSAQTESRIVDAEATGATHRERKFEDKMAAYLKRYRQRTNGNPFAFITCDICYVVAHVARGIVRSGKSEEVLVKVVADLCILFRIEDKRVCKMFVQEYRDEIFYLARHLSLEPWEACGIVLATPCHGHYYPGQNWTVTFPHTPKPQPRPPTPPKPSAPTLRVLHLTDLHLDFQYREGANADCREPLCCREDDAALAYYNSSVPSVKESGDKAGKYGHYGTCDIPSVTLVSLFKHLKNQSEKFDYILFTGDVPPHDIWNQSRADQLRYLHTLDEMFQTNLPGVPVYWAVGNHEAAPCNSFVIPGLPGRNMSWLYEPLAQVWGRWLPQDALSTVRSCAGYSVSPYKGFRIISINSNYCNKDNPWILLNTTDPCGTLQWLISELQQAEDNKEKVHILTHIPPGEAVCLQVWSHNFYDIINRYENTVVNQFYGHNHHDWFQMFYDTSDFQRPLNFGFVTPALTSRDETNPVYRIYTVDGNYEGSSWAVLDYTNYFLNLTEANSEEKATWAYGYNPKTDLNMTSLYAADWEDLVQRMENDDDLFQKFYFYYYNLHSAVPCDEDCKADIICSLKEGRSYDPDLCEIHG
ncbi:sphingomyelin phosphodiesterase [Plakobranchus ocellatus]|uniref:Sphingomyelin phosphodiesterase n=1 Tax=Plakobranchus ocellatus TaxID=259542 RepID=A0AAV3ZCN4_9GAST|nr:sphingomyelin phosphodiesterase [Plakobranchus ocellatus]